ncbi:MAG: FAD-dependent oxidoreductase [Deltaproteobacteria bacterium]|nr:FAD-dependent oxidoreductase [Deltaproteobacteria bacterium]
MSAKIAIVGAGISGLGAGYQLMKAGFKPVIFEKESFTGGRMSSDRVDGFTIDKGAYTFPEFHKNLRRFVENLGMGNNLIQTPGTSSTFSAGKEYKIKIGSAIDFLKYKLISTKSKKDMIKLFLYSQLLGNALDMGQPTQKTFELEKDSATEYLLENYDQEILEKIAYPIFCEIFLGTPEGNSKLAFLATLKNLTNFKIFAFDDGMGMLTECLIKELNVRLKSPVIKISPKADKGPYEVYVGGNNPESLAFDAVIVAIPLPIVPGILELPEELKQYFLDVVYSPSIVTSLAVEGEYSNTSMINSLLRTDCSVLGTLVFDRHKNSKRVPQGKELVTAILCEKASRALFHESEDRITTEVLKEMDTLFHGFSNKLIFSRVYRWEHGAIQVQPGSLLRQHPIRKTLENGFHNLYFAGDGMYKSSLEVSFNTGIRAANLIIKKYGSSPKELAGS